MSVLLQLVGILIALANAVWLAARLLAPHDMTRPEALRIFLPTALLGIVLVWIGRRMGKQALDKLTKQGRAANNHLHASGGDAAA